MVKIEGPDYIPSLLSPWFHRRFPLFCSTQLCSAAIDSRYHSYRIAIP